MPDRVRIQSWRVPGGKKPDNVVIVARPSKWGNPWAVGREGRFWLPQYTLSDTCIGCEMTTDDAVALYRRLLTGGPDPVNRLLPSVLSARGRSVVRDMLRAHAARIIADMDQLRGRDLACYCPLDQPCHADVLLELANREAPDA